MKTKGVRLHGAMDIRVEEFDLPEIKDTEVLMHVVSDTICMSTYKAVKQGTNHKRVPKDIDKNPIIIGHEMCGDIVKVGEKLKDKWKVGQMVVIQPALKLPNFFDPGYSYPYIGGNSIYSVVPKVVLERGCLLPYNGDSYFGGSLCESLGCLVRGYKGLYHTNYETYERYDGAKKGGKIAILAGAGPMGLGAVELAIGYAGVSQVVVTDINEERLEDAKIKVSKERALKEGVKLDYVNTSKLDDPVKELIELSNGGFDDVFVMAPVAEVFTMAEQICKDDGCINFFAGPVNHNIPAPINIYRIHYDGIHIVGTTGGIPEDSVDVINLIEKEKINPGALISHILGLNALPEAIFAMEKPNGLKKVCYNDIDIPLVAIKDLGKLGEKDPLYKKLDEIVKKNNGLWCAEAEKYLLENAPKIK